MEYKVVEDLDQKMFAVHVQDIKTEYQDSARLQRRTGEAYETNPLVHVPEPHRSYCIIDRGEARRTLCDRICGQSHWVSEKHRQRNLALALGSSEPAPLCIKLSQPLPTPRPFQHCAANSLKIDRFW